MKKGIYIIGVLIIFSQCTRVIDNNNWISDDLYAAFIIAVQSMGREKYITVLEKINEEFFLSKNDIRILKLKFSILLTLNNYEEAFSVFNDHQHLFNYEYGRYILNGILSYRTGNEYINYFRNAFCIIYSDNVSESHFVRLYILNKMVDNEKDYLSENQLLSQQPPPEAVA